VYEQKRNCSPGKIEGRESGKNEKEKKKEKSKR
jgi:hypothetical protein